MKFLKIPGGENINISSPSISNTIQYWTYLENHFFGIIIPDDYARNNAFIKVLANHRDNLVKIKWARPIQNDHCSAWRGCVHISSGEKRHDRYNSEQQAKAEDSWHIFVTIVAPAIKGGGWGFGYKKGWNILVHVLTCWARRVNFLPS